MSGPRAGGPRVTGRREAVADALGRLGGFVGAQDLHAELRRSGDPIGLTTVYRHLQSLAEAGELDVLRRDDGETVYRRCATDHHHHHLVCRACGRTVEVEGPTVERWAADVARRHGFREVEHTVEVFGTCPECART